MTKTTEAERLDHPVGEETRRDYHGQMFTRTPLCKFHYKLKNVRQGEELNQSRLMWGSLKNTSFVPIIIPVNNDFS